VETLLSDSVHRCEKDKEREMKSRFWKRPAVRGRRMIMEQLEERIVMDAAVDTIPQSDAFHLGNHAIALDPVHVYDLTHSLTSPNGCACNPHAGTAPVPSGPDRVGQLFDGDLDVILVSDALEGAKQVASAASPHAKVIVYNAAQDNLDTINAKLTDLVSSTGKKISHLAVASHGEDGILALGSERMDLTGAIAHRMAFKELSNNLEPHAQIQLYSCSLAGNDEGKMVVNSVAAMTGADVFASTDVTGAKPHNWVLEYSSYPRAQMSSILDADKLEQVPGQLAQLPVTNLAPSDPHIDSFNREIPGTPGRMPVTLANEVIYAADNGAGQEVYKSPVVPNVANGTIPQPPPASAQLTNFPVLDPNVQGLTEMNGATYYSAFNTNATGYELMRSNASDLSAPPNPISNFGAGVNDYDPHISQITAQTNNALFFAAQQANQPANRDSIELWRSNGGPNGATVTDFGNNPVSRFGPANAGDIHTDIAGLVPAKDNLSVYFSATSPRTTGSAGIHQGTEVWRSTGTVPVAPDITDLGGTERGAVSRFGDIALYAGFNPDISQLVPAVSAASNATAYFVGNEPSTGYEVWRTDGGVPGIAQVTANANGGLGNVTNFGLGTPTDPRIHDLTFVPDAASANLGHIYFVADDGSGAGAQIWRSDGGLPGGSVTDRGANAQVTSFGVNANISQLTQYQGQLFFVGNEPSGGTEDYEIFRVIPATGTDVALPVTDFQGADSAHSNAHVKLITFTPENNYLWFEADSIDNKSREIFSVDLSGAIPQYPAQRTNMGYADPQFAFLTDAGGVPVFAATGATTGQELFTIGNTAPQVTVPSVAGSTILEDANNHNLLVPMPNLLRITDPDTNDRLSITVSVATNGSEGFSQQTDATGTLQPALFFDPSVLPVGTSVTVTQNNAQGTSWTIEDTSASAATFNPFTAQTDINAVLATLQGFPNRNTNALSDVIAGTTHQIHVAVDDGHWPGGLVPDNLLAVNVTPVNDQPVFNPSTIGNDFPGVVWGGQDLYPVPGARPTPVLPQVVPSGDSLVFNDAHTNRIGVADVDAYEVLGPGWTPADGVIHANLFGGAGNLHLATTAGLTPDPGTAVTGWRPVLGFTGTIADINNALNGMSFKSAPYFEGASNITIILDDTSPFGFPATGQPESGAITVLPPIPPLRPVVGTIPLNVTPPSGDFFGRLYVTP
jgi:hypothetical protein